MAEAKQKTGYRGVRFREHATEKFNKRPDKCFFIRYKRNGQTIEESVGWASEDFTAQQASMIRAQIVHNIKTGSGPQSLREMQEQSKHQKEIAFQQTEEERRQALSLADVADHYLAWAQKNKKSWKEDEIRLKKYILPQLGKNRLVDLDRQHGLEFLDWLQNQTWRDKPISPATIKQCLSLARRIIYFASDTPMPGSRQTMFRGDNPLRRIKMPKLDNARWRYLTYEEARIVLEAVKKPCPEALVRTQAAADRLWLICRFSLYAGARLSEVIHIRPEHVFSDSGLVRLVDTKHGSRSVYPDDETMSLLENHISSHTYVFGSPIPGQPIQRHYVGNAFSRIVNDRTTLNQGVTDPRARITFHSLRHTYGTWQIYGGMDIETLSRLMGHTELRTTRRYVHLAEDFKAQMAARARIKSFQLNVP